MEWYLPWANHWGRENRQEDLDTWMFSILEEKTTKHCTGISLIMYATMCSLELTIQSPGSRNDRLS